MGERAHTPGPWLLELDNFGDYTVHRQNETLAIAAVVNGEMRRMGNLSGQHEANARLIAAAPDMFEALKHILAGALSLPRFAEEEARAALAKAEGRSSTSPATAAKTGGA